MAKSGREKVQARKKTHFLRIQTGGERSCLQNYRLRKLLSIYFTMLAVVVVILLASFQGASPRGDPFPFRVPLDPLGTLELSWNDAWSDAQGHIRLDSKQDYQLLEAHRAPEGFYLTFKRSFSTCDPNDYLIEDGTVHLIYGVLDRPVTSLLALNLSLVNRGLQRVQLLKPNITNPELPPDVQTLEVLAPNMSVPGQETTYWCYITELPENMPKNHIAMYESVITPGNEALVHHMEVFQCAPQFDSIPNYSGPCDSKMKPQRLNYCRHVLAAWALGAKAFYYPEEAGLAIGGPDSSKYLRLEVHYHNPLQLKGSLSAAALPAGGIHIFASQLHTHLTGTAVRTMLLRDGREVETVNVDNHFSTHFQEIRMLKKMVTVLPGDVLLTACTYNTQDREKATVGGFGILEEMCVNYIHYYPHTELELCKSAVDYRYLQKYFAFMNRFHDDEICSCPQAAVPEQFAAVSWDPFSKDVLWALYSTSPISMHCNQSSATRFPGDWERQSLPQVTTSLPKPQYKCETTREPQPQPQPPAVIEVRTRGRL
ncbi:UNVERIFIED_CONTAM: hypothetical protein FKN15_007079 [Acipenser sinensis]